MRLTPVGRLKSDQTETREVRTTGSQAEIILGPSDGAVDSLTPHPLDSAGRPLA